MNKIFGKLNISWRFLIIFSISIGIIVGTLNKIPVLYNTSFTDIAVYLEMWVILAIFIIVNCKSEKEAAFKCFVFFLISQPLIYLTEIIIETLVYSESFKAQFMLYFRNYYIGGGWALYTLLTLPGAVIAYQIKKEKILTGVVLAIATGFLAFTGVKGILNVLLNGRINHLLNSLICVYMAFRLIYLIIKNKNIRLIPVVVNIIAILLGIIFVLVNIKKPIMAIEEISFKDDVTIVKCYSNDLSIAKAVLSENGKSMNVFSSENVGITKIIAVDSNNEEYVYLVESTSKEFNITLSNDD